MIASCDTDGIVLSYTNIYNATPTRTRRPRSSPPVCTHVQHGKIHKLTLGTGGTSLGARTAAPLSLVVSPTLTMTTASPVVAASSFVSAAALVITG